MGIGGHNVLLIKCKNCIRKRMPKETFNLQVFTKNYILPNELSNISLYKQAKNGGIVPLINKIISQIKVIIWPQQVLNRLVFYFLYKNRKIYKKSQKVLKYLVKIYDN